MKISLFFIFNSIFILICFDNLVDCVRSRRSIPNLRQIILCRRPSCAFIYNGYGCYCGEGNRGLVAVDDIDSCCKIHDECYDKIQQDCGKWGVYVNSYVWKCHESRMPSNITAHSYPTCLDAEDTAACSYRTCECDRELAMCLARFPCPTLQKRKQSIAKCIITAKDGGESSNLLIMDYLYYLFKNRISN